MLPEKSNIICLLKILYEYSDSSHPLAMGKIIEKMEKLYGMKPDRRTIVSGIDTLIGLGYEISAYNDNKKGYYLISRDFEPGEIYLLMDAVYSFPFITEGQNLDLIEKIKKSIEYSPEKEPKPFTNNKGWKKEFKQADFLSY